MEKDKFDEHDGISMRDADPDEMHPQNSHSPINAVAGPGDNTEADMEVITF